MTTALVLMNAHGKVLAVVEPFENDEAALDFFRDTASAAYAKCEVVTSFTPNEYKEK